MKRKLARIVQKSGRWYIAYVKKLPGANTLGRTLAETRRSLDDAVTLIIAASRELSFKRR